jgi:lipopolysaccharide transport system ATP-binding protein
MSDQPAIRLSAVGKRYTLYPSPLDGACDALGLAWLLPKRRKLWRQFWALRNISLTLPRGARIGIIGRNGAGKSTLLKLITRNIDPTEGTVEVHGEVQALLQAGTGMHPEFTGRENIEAALTYQGLTGADVEAAVADILEFTELGPFLGQPFKTYSTGMQARLAFAAATAVRPDILIVDELLGVGDGYFLSKSTERMRRLIEGGASVLLVSHAMEQIVRFCQQAIWVDRGQIVRQGDALEVVKEYERYLRLLDERRLRAENARKRGNVAADAEAGDEARYTDALEVRFRVPAGARLRVGQVELLENDRAQDRLHVGGPQDVNPGAGAALQPDTLAAWSEPQIRGGQMFREVAGERTAAVAFSLYLFDPSVAYAFDIDYQLDGPAVVAEVCHNDAALQAIELSPAADWQRARIACPAKTTATPRTTTSAGDGPLKLVHWPGLGGLLIEGIRLLDEDGADQSLFEYGRPMTVAVRFRAAHAGTFPCQPALTVYRRSDGVNVTQFVGPSEVLILAAGEEARAVLRLGPLQLGNDTYVIASSLFRKLDPQQIEPAERYDTIDRSVQFKVYGREPFRRGVFQHPGEWSVERAPEAGGLTKST